MAIAAPALETARGLAFEAFDQMPCGVVIATSERVLLANRHALGLLELSPREALARPGLPSLFVESQRARLLGAVDVVLHHHVPEPLALQATRGDGTTVDVEVRMSALPAAGEGVVLAMLLDAWHHKRTAGSLERLAYQDALTGLPNRASFVDALGRLLHSGKRRGDRFALGLVDLDGFKAVNDTAGHEAGDVVLREVSDRLRRSMRETDVVARLGGDEFTVLLPGVADAESARKAALSVHRAFERPFSVRNAEFSLGASVGFAIYPLHGQDAQALLIAADSAMYAGKRDGKGRTCIFDGVTTGHHFQPRILIEWSPEYDSGFTPMDAEHHELAERLNAVITDLANGEDHERVRLRLRELGEHARIHFSSEEAAMSACLYPGRLHHMHEHRHLLHELVRLEEAIEEQPLSQTIQLLRDWFVLHVRDTDKQFARALEAAEAAAAESPTEETLIVPGHK